MDSEDLSHLQIILKPNINKRDGVMDLLTIVVVRAGPEEKKLKTKKEKMKERREKWLNSKFTTEQLLSTVP